MSDDKPRVYTLDEAAEILHLTKRTLYNYIKAGTLKAVKMGKFWRVSDDDLQDFIKTGTPIADANRRKENQGK